MFSIKNHGWYRPAVQCILQYFEGSKLQNLIEYFFLTFKFQRCLFIMADDSVSAACSKSSPTDVVIPIESLPLLNPSHTQQQNDVNTLVSKENSCSSNSGGNLNNLKPNSALSAANGSASPASVSATSTANGVLIKKVANVSDNGYGKKKMKMTHLVKRPPVDVEFKVSRLFA